jgi:thioesterase domain-containing protein/acyl carrier protein
MKDRIEGHLPSRDRGLACIETDAAVQGKLVDIWEITLAQRSVSVTDNYFQLGGTSLQAVRLFGQIEEAFGMSLPLSTLLHAPTIAELSDVISRSGAATPWSCLVEIQPGGLRRPLFCVHGAMGNVLLYRDLARQLGPEQPFYGLQPQGLCGKAPILTRVEDMAALYVHEIQRVQPQAPYFLGGYCGGGTIALEMAQQLYSRGKEVVFLALIDCYNWSNMKRRSVVYDLYFHLQKTLFRCENLLLLDSEQRLRCRQRQLKELAKRTKSWPGLLIDALTRGRRQRPISIQLCDAMTRAALSYTPKVYPGRIFHFKPMKQYAKYNGPELGWDKIAAGGVEEFVLPVCPPGLLVEPFVRHLADKLRSCLETLTDAVD